MTSSTEKKKKRIIDLAYLAIIIALLVLVVKYALGVCLPFVAALLIAAILQRPKNFLVRKTPLKKGSASAILVLFTIALIIALIILLGSTLVGEIKSFISYLGGLFSDWQTMLENIKNWLIGVTEKLPASLRASAESSITGLYDSIVAKLNGSAADAANAAVDAAAAAGTDAAQAASDSGIMSLLSGSFSLSTLSKPISGIVSTVSQIPSALIAAIMSIVACCFMTADYDKIKGFVKAQFPDSRREDLSRAKVLLKSSLGKMGKAYGLIMLITFSEMTIGLYILKFLGIFSSNFIVLIAIGTAIVDIIPVLGTGTVVLPWAAYSFIVSDYKMGIGLIIIYAIITVLRQIIEPKLVAGQLGLSPVVTITSMYFGLKVFGVLGMIVTPLLIIMIKLLNDEGIIHFWKTPPEKLTQDKEQPKQKRLKKGKK